MTANTQNHEAPAGNLNHTKAVTVIIGAGIAGMCMAIDLIKRNQCQNFIILEKSASIGGTWYDNKYPGCCCDVWSLLYSLSFEQNPDWSREYPGQEEILDYLRGVAQKYNLYRHIRFNTEVKECRWDDGENKWRIDVEVNGGEEIEFSPKYTIDADFLVSGVGQLNYPRYPDIPGLKDFKGKMMHSARWDWSYDMTGKRIAVIGNGATAVQIIPEVVKVAKHVTVFQRTPNWFVPRLDGPVSAVWKALYRYVPPVRWRMRAGLMDFREMLYAAVADSKSDMAEMTRKFTMDMLMEEFPNDPEMRKKLTPDYDAGCKRIILSDEYYATLKKDNCSLQTKPIQKMTQTGIEVDQGELEEFDMIVLATGFRTVEFMHPIKMYGAGGRSLADVWKAGARALYGITVEDMPNFGMLYGPNTNLGHNSIILMIEAQSRYINALIGAVLDAKKKGSSLAIRPRAERIEEYNDEIQATLAKSAFADPRCKSWYRNKDGKITNNWSGTVVEYQKMLSKVIWGDYDLVGAESSIIKAQEKKEIGRVVEETQFSNTTMLIGAVSTVVIVGGYLARDYRLLSRLWIR